VSIPISVGMVPLRMLLPTALQQNEAHRVRLPAETITPKKKTRGKIHSQSGQRCEHPNLSGNGSTQAVLIQYPTAKEGALVNATETPPKEDDKRQNKIHSQIGQRCKHPSQSQTPQIPSPRKIYEMMRSKLEVK